MTARAFVEKDACVSGHDFDGSVAADRAGKPGLEDDASCVHLCASRQTITARPPAMIRPGRLNHTGTTYPATTTSQPVNRRNRCTRAMSVNKATAIVVNGFMAVLPDRMPALRATPSSA